MQLCSLAALLILQCWMPVILGDDSQSMMHIHFKGSELRVYEIDGAQVAEPRVSFGDSCGSLRYNRLYLKYQLTVPIHIDVNTLESPVGDSAKKVGKVVLTGLKVIADEALAGKDSSVTVIAHVLKSSGEAQLIFLCNTFLRCQGLKEDVSSNPQDLWHAVKFAPVGSVGSSSVEFGAIRSANSPNLTCNPGRWVVFQRRVDGSLSFAQNWDAYVKGFGNPKSNYWMGLNRLSAMTVTSTENEYSDTSRCQLRVETEDFSGRSYWGEYKLFEVLGPEHNYLLRLGQEVSGSHFVNILQYHNERQFSTYDSDHDVHGAGSCSQQFGYGGWWYGACHTLNLNGAYTTDKSIVNNPTYCSAYTSASKHVPMKSTLMKFRCN